MKRLNNRTIGKEKEEKAVNYLIKNGYIILERNYLRKMGEIDIIAKKDGYLIAIEVKYRSTNRFGSPFSAVTLSKQRKIINTLLYYIAENEFSLEIPCRFDVIGIYGNGNIVHMKNAFGVV